MQVLPGDIRTVKNSLKQKLLFSHLSLAGIGVVLLLVALISTLWLRDSTLRLALESGPKFEALKSLENGVQHSLAALRGWVVLGNPEFQKERRATWEKEIWPWVDELEKHLHIPAALAKQHPLEKLERLLADLSEWQWRIADVANTPGNEPAQVAFQHNMAPVTDSIETGLADLVKLTKRPRKTAKGKILLVPLLEFRHLFSQCRGLLVSFLRTADPGHEERFHRKLNSALRLWRIISDNKDGLTGEQKELLRWIGSEFKAYVFFSREILSLRKGGTWNVAQDWLGRQALPLERKISDRLRLLLRAVEQEVERNAKEATAFSRIAIPLIWVSIVVMIVAAVFISKYGAEQITRPIGVLVRGVKKFARGRLSANIPVASGDEVGVLTQSFNAMRVSLEESYGRTQAIVDSAVDGIITFDPHGTVESFNKAAERIFGYSAGEVVGRNIKMLVPQSLFKKLDEYFTDDKLKTGVRSGGIVREIQGKRKEGSVFPMDLAISEMRRGNKPLLIAIVRDISDRKRIEEDLERHRGYLEELVEERTRALKAAQKELVRKERLAILGELSAKVSHELRNPLGIVRNVTFSLAQLLRGNKDAERPLTLANRAIERCDNIIEELLDYARPHERNLEPTDVDRLLDELIDEQTPPEPVTVIRKLAAGVKVDLDRERFRRAMINVLHNGYQALIEKCNRENGNTGRKTECRLFVETRIAGSRLEIRIQDTGIGIPRDQLEKIFEPLYSTKSFGVGLGLSIVREILQQHGGGIEIKSQPGESTTVILWLPLKAGVNTV
ncbi:MAG: PAS domain S-box protein [Nitrospinales bacterium]